MHLLVFLKKVIDRSDKTTKTSHLTAQHKTQVKKRMDREEIFLDAFESHGKGHGQKQKLRVHYLISNRTLGKVKYGGQSISMHIYSVHIHSNRDPIFPD